MTHTVRSWTAVVANAKFTDLQATGNTGYAAIGISRLQLLDSNVTGNNGRGLGIDITAGGGLTRGYSWMILP